MKMSDAMVTARMSTQKKESGNLVFEQLGTNASQAINGLYDYVIRNKQLPYDQQPKLGLGKYSKKQLREAAEWVDGLVMPDSRFAYMTDDEIKRERLAAKGLL
jgi:addiction module RelB/DinJ family antitoxin